MLVKQENAKLQREIAQFEEMKAKVATTQLSSYILLDIGGKLSFETQAHTITIPRYIS